MVEVNQLMEECNDDLELVLFKLVYERDSARQSKAEWKALAEKKLREQVKLYVVAKAMLEPMGIGSVEWKTRCISPMPMCLIKSSAAPSAQKLW
jgi:hypothetical protein